MDLPKCKQDGCTVSSDGKCLEGIETKDCPHFYLLNDEVLEEQDTDSQNEVSNQNYKQLYSGDEIPISHINSITHRYKAKLISIIGESDSGKTTLLATLYDMFQSGKMVKWLFAGSQTLIGFEKRCHLSRLTSGMNIPDTQRTHATKDLKFLHLAVKSDNKEIEEQVHLLFSDISGEILNQAKNDSEEMTSLEILKSAEWHLVLLDGKKLSDKRTRYSCITNIDTFVQKALDENIFTNETKINIAVSKWDLLDKIQSFDIDTLIYDRFNSKFAHRLGELKFSKLASRPDLPSEIVQGHGIEELMEDWCNSSESSANQFSSRFDLPNYEKRYFSNLKQ